MGAEDLTDSKVGLVLSLMLLDLMVDSKEMQAKMVLKLLVIVREKSIQALILCTTDKFVEKPSVSFYLSSYESFLV